MAKVKLDIGAEIDTVSKGELDSSLKDDAVARERERLRGIKYMRAPRLYGTVTAGAVTLGNSAPFCGPASGYAWSIKRLGVSGLTVGSTPDIINIYRNGTNLDPLWQLNGNNFSYTFGKLDIVLLGGEFLMAENLGTISASGVITLVTEVIEVPQELLGKLA